VHIRLDIQNPGRARSGSPRSITFGALGGTIGQSENCDWVLQDEGNAVPDKAATILFDGQRFVLWTHATGLSVNGARRALAPGRQVVLQDEDTVSIGALEIGVRIGSLAHVEKRLQALETLVLERSDAVADLLDGASPRQTNPPALTEVDPITLLDQSSERQTNLDPLALWDPKKQPPAATAASGLETVMDMPSRIAATASSAASPQGFDPVSLPAIRKDSFGFEEVPAESDLPLAAVLDPAEIEAHVAVILDPSSEVFGARCWAVYRDRVAALKKQKGIS
jgi:predicted component of type VI protein secretion system